jgi:hypothetical protein
MLPVFRVHVHRAGSLWAWEVRLGRGPAARTRAGAAGTRADTIRAALSPAAFWAEVHEQYQPQQAA